MEPLELCETNDTEKKKYSRTRLPESFINRFLDEVKKRPRLWDSRHPHFKKGNHHQWEDLGAIFNKKGGYVKNLWFKIRGRFFRRLSEEYDRNKTISEEFLSNLDLYPKCRFLVDTNQKPPQWRTKESRKQAEELIDSIKRISQKPAVGSRKAAARVERDKREMAVAEFQSNRESDLDADYLYMMSLLPSLKKIPFVRRAKVMIAIQNAVYEEMLTSDV